MCDVQKLQERAQEVVKEYINLSRYVKSRFCADVESNLLHLIINPEMHLVPPGSLKRTGPEKPALQF